MQLVNYIYFNGKTVIMCFAQLKKKDYFITRP